MVSRHKYYTLLVLQLITFMVQRAYALNEKCINPMIVAQNKSHLITHKELPKFIMELAVANGLYDPRFAVESNLDLPYQILIDYNNIICSGKNDCTDGIDVSGVDNFNNLSPSRQEYLESICSKFVRSMKKVLGPSEPPSITPTSSPTKSPVKSPTKSPTSSPTESPSITKSPTTQPEPTDAPTRTKLTVAIPFGVANLYSLSASEVSANVGGIMEVINTVFSDFAEEVESVLFTQTIGGRRKLTSPENDSRKLAVDFDYTYVTNLVDDECSPVIVQRFKNTSPSPRCMRMEGTIEFIATPPTNAAVAVNFIKQRSEERIRDGNLNDKTPVELQDDLTFYSLNPDTPIIPVAAITGIAIGAALVGLIAGRLLVKRTKKNEDEYNGLQGCDSSGESTDDLEIGNKESPVSDQGGNIMDVSVASSSNAGSSGWSSSAGMSSLNTGSVDSSEYFGASLAAIGAASNMTKKYRKSPPVIGYPIVSDMDDSSMSNSDLDTDDEYNFEGHKQSQFAIKDELYRAIKLGDWSLVGATAAIIAQSPTDFLTAQVDTSNSSGFSSDNSNIIDAEKAAELDRLVENGDWEGVVLAAAKYEAESDKDGGTEGSASNSEGHKFLDSRSHASQGDANSTNSPSISTASNNLKRAEIRAEVEALVRRVVPDEIDNVDEMMHQFRGREEELLETLRTMQERSIAARQREANRRNAKREARKTAKSNKPPLGRKASEDLSSSFYSATSKIDSDDPSRQSNQESNTTPSRVALDNAIQIGDWEAVGKTATLLCEESVSSGSDYHSVQSTENRSLGSSLMSATDTARAAELEDLIDKGDWSGVVAAASRFTVADKHKRRVKGDESISKDSGFDDSVSQSTEAKKEKTLKEEEDALAQAEIWMTIAAQSKNQNSTATKGASDAADWAISQSLKQIAASNSIDRQESQSVTSSSGDDKSV